MKKINIKDYDLKKISLLTIALLFLMAVLVLVLNGLKQQQIVKKKAGEAPFTAHCDWNIDPNKAVSQLVELSKNCNGIKINIIPNPLKEEKRPNRTFYYAYFKVEQSDIDQNCQFYCKVIAKDINEPEKCNVIKDTKVIFNKKQTECPNCLLDINIELPPLGEAWDDAKNKFSQLIKNAYWANFNFYKIGRIKIKPKPTPNNTTCPASQCGKIYFNAYDNNNCSGQPITPTPAEKGQNYTYNISCADAQSDQGAKFILHQAKGNDCRCYKLKVEDQNKNVCFQQEMQICCPTQCISEYVDDPTDLYDDRVNDIPNPCDPDNDTTCSFEPLTNACPQPGDEITFKTYVDPSIYKDGSADIDFDDDFKYSKKQVELGFDKRYKYVYDDAGTYDVKLNCRNADGTVHMSCTYRITATCGQGTPPGGGGGGGPTPINLTPIIVSPTTPPPYITIPIPSPDVTIPIPENCYLKTCNNDVDCAGLEPPMKCIDVGGGLGKRCVVNDGPCDPQNQQCWCLPPTPTPTPGNPTICPLPNPPLVKVICPNCCNQ